MNCIDGCNGMSGMLVVKASFRFNLVLLLRADNVDDSNIRDAAK